MAHNEQHSKYDLLQRFAKSKGLVMRMGKTTDRWNYEITLVRVNQPEYVDDVLYGGTGFTKDEAYDDLLQFIMFCKGWKNEDEMRIWLDLNSSSTCH